MAKAPCSHDYCSPLSDHDEEQSAFLREILRWRDRHEGRIPTLIEGFRIAIAMGYRRPTDDTSSDR